MTKIRIIRKCQYLSPGMDYKIWVVPGRIVEVERDQAEKMVKGNVAEFISVPAKAEPKKVVK